MKRKTGWDDPKPKRGPGVPTVGPANYCLKLLVSKFVAAGLIGRGGGAIKEIRQLTGAYIHLSGKAEFFPDTNQQEANVQCNNEEMLQAAFQTMIAKICELEPSQATSLKLSMVVPSVTAATLIDKEEAVIKEIKAATGAKMHVEEPIHGHGDAAEQVISIVGPPDSAFAAALQISALVQELKDQPWFGAWAAQSTASDVPAPGFFSAPTFDLQSSPLASQVDGGFSDSVFEDIAALHGSQALVSEVPGTGVMYRVIGQPGILMRAGVELDSAEVGTLPYGDTFEAFEAGQDGNGSARLRTPSGWVSEVSKAGKPLVEVVDSAALGLDAALPEEFAAELPHGNGGLSSGGTITTSVRSFFPSRPTPSSNSSKLRPPAAPGLTWKQPPANAGVGAAAHDQGALTQEPGDGQLTSALLSTAAGLPAGLAQRPGPQIGFAVPSGLMSGLIGRGGCHIKDILSATGARVSIRDVDDDSSQKTVLVSGSVVGVSAAYLKVVQRLAELEGEMTGGLPPS